MTWILLLFLPSSALRAPAGKQDDPVRQAIDKLRSPDAAERQAAEDAIRKAGAKAVPAILATLENDQAGLKERVAEAVAKLSDPDWKKRDEASKAIVRLGRHALKHLTDHEAAGDPEVAWRVKAAMAELQERSGQEESEEQARNVFLLRILGELGDARGVKTVLKALTAPSVDARLAAAESVGRLAAHLKPEETEEASERILELFREHKPALARCLMIKTLASLRSPVCVKPLALFLLDPSEKNVNVKRNALAALASIGDAEAIRAVVETLANEDPYVRQGALLQLERLAGQAWGYDPRLTGEENRDAILGFRRWWEKKFSSKW